MAKKKINSFLLSSNSDVRSYYQYLYFRVLYFLGFKDSYLDEHVPSPEGEPA